MLSYKEELKTSGTQETCAVWLPVQLDYQHAWVTCAAGVPAWLGYLCSWCTSMAGVSVQLVYQQNWATCAAVVLVQLIQHLTNGQKGHVIATFTCNLLLKILH